MKSMFPFLTFFLSIIILKNGYAQWVPTNGPYGGDISTIHISANGSYTFAGTENGGIFVSTNKGGKWNKVNNGLTDLTINALAAYPNGSGGGECFCRRL